MARGKKKEKELTPEEKLQQALVPKEEHPYPVPDNWQYYRINGIVTHLKRGKAPKYVEQSDIPVFAQKCNQKDGTISLEKAQFLNPEVASRIKEEEFLKDEDVLINSTGTGTLGRVGYYRSDYSAPYKKVLPDSHMTVIRGIAVVSQNYLYYYLKSKQDYLEQQGVGTTNQKELRPETIGNIVIPLPPLPEQQRIVNRIESLFAKLDEAKERAQAVVDGFEDRKAAILHKAFTGELTAEWRKKRGISSAEWKAKTVGEISYVKGGKRVPKGMSLTDVDTGHPYLKAGNLKQGTVIDKDLSFVPDDVLPLIKNYTVKAGDVYITNVGACIGDCGVIPTRFDGANLTENAVKLTNLQCISEYLALYLSSNSVQSFIKTLIASATLGKLSIANIKTIPILLPSEEEQNQVIELIEKLLGKELDVRKIAEQVTDQIDVMKKSILARAFRGELGTNDPADESAEELLKKIL